MVYKLSLLYDSLHVFSYITTRAAFAAITALLFMIVSMPYFIQVFKKKQAIQIIREDGPKHHTQTKQQIPTMGGVPIILSVLLSTSIWGALENSFVLISLLTLLLFAGIGFWDDGLKIFFKHSRGMSAKTKLILQVISSIIIISLMYMYTNSVDQKIYIPMLKQVSISVGVLYILWGIIVIVGSSNAVNLTDGLDGLAILPVVLVGGGLGVFAYATGHYYFSSYLLLPFVPGAGELTIICGSLIGAGLGFLWYNTYPAQIFMGDVGSLSLGAVLAVLALMIKQELVLLIMGIIFVAEALSVIIQVASFKLRKKRVFKMAPLHHHFELLGWSEPKIIVRFWVFTFIFVLIGLATLKIR
ncbi:MAG: phospho-N-acetylmuramoyl-pentapeptide-transferase [Methylacidiphilales bacterium]|nr:phospho-N-acetylmuramoyl-pentapeptide-transferase [Candidatus Methylacidiphilales bacterium]